MLSVFISATAVAFFHCSFSQAQTFLYQVKDVCQEQTHTSRSGHRWPLHSNLTSSTPLPTQVQYTNPSIYNSCLHGKGQKETSPFVWLQSECMLWAGRLYTLSTAWAEELCTRSYLLAVMPKNIQFQSCQYKKKSKPLSIPSSSSPSPRGVKVQVSAYQHWAFSNYAKNRGVCI